jgi:hypothetical protein
MVCEERNWTKIVLADFEIRGSCHAACLKTWEVEYTMRQERTMQYSLREPFGGVERLCHVPDNTICTLTYNILNVILLGHIEGDLARSRRGIRRTGRHLRGDISCSLYLDGEQEAEQRLRSSGCNRYCRL